MVGISFLMLFLSGTFSNNCSNSCPLSQNLGQRLEDPEFHNQDILGYIVKCCFKQNQTHLKRPKQIKMTSIIKRSKREIGMLIIIATELRHPPEDV